MENKKIAIYPGSFNPFTTGHLNILEKAEAIFGKENVIIAVGINPDKLNPNTEQFSAVKTIKDNLRSKTVEGFKGFLTDYIWEKEKLGFDVTVIKGLRNGDDLDYEVNQLRFMEEMKPDIKVVFITCDKQFEHVSSSAYRALEKVRPGSGHRYLAKELPSSEMVSNTPCVVVVKENETDILEKYTMVSAKIVSRYPDCVIGFSGTYIECLNWIKEQTAKNEKMN